MEESKKEEKEENNSPSLIPAKVFNKKVGLGLLVLLLLGLVAGGTLFAGTYVYAESIGPGVKVGPFKVGGMNPDDARALLHTEVDRLLEDGLSVSYQSKNQTIPLSPVGTSDPDNYQEYIYYAIDEAIDRAYEISHDQNVIYDAFRIAVTGITRPNIEVSTQINRDAIMQEVMNAFPDLAEPPVDAGYKIIWQNGAWRVEVTEAESGQVIDEALLFANLEVMVNNFTQDTIELRATFSEADVSETSAEGYVPEITKILANAPYAFTNEDEVHEWELSAEQIAAGIELEKREGQLQLGLNPESMEEYLNVIAETVEIEARDAHFEMDGERVLSFTTSRNGIKLLRDETLAAMVSAWAANESSAVIVTEVTEPRVSMAEVNDLGITEVLGVGTSDFSGSPYNRIQNIKHGASKLNGILIAPDEEFSLLAALKPFTIEDGYLSELVIKGDEIKPEVGGGLCQIGTTTFRAAMNSGLPVTQRANHSLVVSYYDDPANGNPGTDATIYDPAPDLRFLNDTGNYVLFTTQVDEPNRILTFTFWGTNDGRNGYYSAPVVSGWSSPGETQYVETEDLAPGAEQCQGAHYGANASFTYYIERPDGEIEQTLYSSHYRALPRICLVGYDPDNPLNSEGEEETETEQSEESGDEIPEEIPEEESTTEDAEN
ncbi:VanW family protein [Patescibacteria group bacterium]|nr:VanW family protein [Patescibacteria group bacterium]MBU1906903.1 VanW family protein [Patescibacteria group bacterium]